MTPTQCKGEDQTKKLAEAVKSLMEEKVLKHPLRNSARSRQSLQQSRRIKESNSSRLGDTPETGTKKRNRPA